MSLKVHFLHSYLDYFPENLEDLSEEQRERSHQDMKEMERLTKATGMRTCSQITVLRLLLKEILKLFTKENQ